VALSDEELRAVLERAEEIQRTSRHGEAWNAEVAAVISAGEGVGLSRESVQRAIAERVGVPVEPPAVGALVWARSADGQYYLAEVVASNDAEAHVRFLRGGEHRLALDGVRVASFLPGEKLLVDWPMWGAAECVVVAYDAAQQTLQLADSWGYIKTFHIAEVWRVPPRAVAHRRPSHAWIIVGSATAGALLGTIATALLLR
jgi:hypothetical protein